MLVRRLSASFATCVTLLALFCGAAGAVVVVVPRSAHLPAMRGPASQARAATTQNYTLHDLGVPGPGSAPYVFNNTGQIVGISGKDCVVWTGRAYRPLPFSGALTGCSPYGINDANAVTGHYEIVGAVGARYLQGQAAFAVLADATGFTKNTYYYWYPNSTLTGVNSNGVSIGFAGFNPVDTRELSGNLLFTNVLATHYFQPLQAPIASQPPVHYLLPDYPGGRQCAFGGCLINDLNEVVGADYFSSESSNPTLALYTLGNPSSFTVLPISAAQCCLPIALNNKNQILLNAPADDPVPELYDVTTRKMTQIPSATQLCPSGPGYAIGLNNNGVVLGESDTETAACNWKYFIWDPINGTQAVQLQAAYSNSTIYALGINDKREILVEFITGSGAYDWGVLEPNNPSGTLKPRARANH